MMLLTCLLYSGYQVLTQYQEDQSERRVKHPRKIPFQERNYENGHWSMSSMGEMLGNWRRFPKEDLEMKMYRRGLVMECLEFLELIG